MKRLLLLSVFCCLGFIALSQSTVKRIYATGVTGSFTTGNATAISRNEGNIVSTGTTQRGYAVFDLDSIPATAVISSVVIRFNVATYGGSGTPSGWQTYGYEGDLSLETSPPVLFANMIIGTLLSGTTYGTGVGNQNLPTSAASVGFVQTNIGEKISISWTGGASRIYTITGQAGLIATTGAHAPYLEVTYTCPGITGVTATAAPNPVCPGNSVTLTGGGSGVTYSWKGPGLYTATGATATRVISTAAETGVYTLTATNSTGCFIDVFTPVVNLQTPPAAITPSAATSICVGGTVTLANATAGGTWSTASAAIATVSSGGVVTGVSQGVTNISYTVTSTTCWVVKPVTVNATPGAFSPAAPRVCIGSTMTLSNSSTGGTWSSSASGTASVAAIAAAPNSAIVTGVAVGTAIITYSNGCGGPGTVIVTVDPLPGAITGPTNVCEAGGTITLASVTPDGTWSSSANVSTSAISTTEGLITGINDGTATVTYTSPLGCRRSTTLIVNPAPNEITGNLRHCIGTATTLANTVTGGTWTSSTLPVAIVVGPGVIIGVSGGYSTISYSNACGVATAIDTVVNIPPPFIGGDTVCLGGTLVLADAVLGGTWSSSRPGEATVLPGSGIVTGVDTGWTVITYSLLPGCFIDDTVRIILGPPAITGTMEVCPGNTVVLSNSSAGGTWSSAAPGLATVNATTGVVTGVAPGAAAITYTDVRGCAIDATVNVNSVPLPIVGESLFCAGIIDTFYNPSLGGAWSSLTPGVVTIGATTGIANLVNGGIGVIRYTFTATGCFINKTITVLPKPSPNVVYNYFTNTFEADSGFVTYQWYNNTQGMVPGATTRTTAAQYNGYYYLVVTDTNGCVGQSANINYNSSMLGVGGANQQHYDIYPNPAETEVFIAGGLKADIVICDVAGREEISVMGANSVNISKLPAGLHFVTLYGENGAKLTTVKLVKR